MFAQKPVFNQLFLLVFSFLTGGSVVRVRVGVECLIPSYTINKNYWQNQHKVPIFLMWHQVIWRWRKSSKQ